MIQFHIQKMMRNRLFEAISSRLSRHILCILLFILTLFPLKTVPVLADSSIESIGQIQITAEYDGKALQNLPFSLFKIGTIDEDGNISLAEPYASYPIDFSNTSSTDWAALSETLAGYIQLNQEMPFQQGETDERGMLNLALDGSEVTVDSSLQTGESEEAEKGTDLYLLTGHSLEKDGMLYTVSPAFLNSADLDTEGQLRVCAKVSGKKSEVQELTVHKKWNGITDPAQRPESIDVSLLKNGSVVEKVQLSEQNNWTYTWTKLSGSFEWNCAETPVTGFKTTVSRLDSLLVITNTRIPDSKSKDTLPYTGTDGRLYVVAFFLGSIMIVISLLLKGRRGHFAGKLFGLFFLILSIAGTASLELQMLKADQARKEVLEEMEEKLKSTDGSEDNPATQNNSESLVNTSNGESLGNTKGGESPVDENGCIGIIQIPELGICMPVTENWDYDKLEWAACIYYGSPMDSSMVIAGHSYVTFFRSLRQAQEEQSVIFTDLKGKSTQYRVAQVEILQPEETDRMVNSDWDLTLFTCTSGSTARCAVRCEKII